MIRTLFILIALSLTADAQIISKRKPVVVAAGGVTTNFFDGFESGTQGSWLKFGTTDAVFNYATSPAPLDGSYSIYLDASVANCYYYIEMATVSEAYCYMRVRYTQLPSADAYQGGFNPASAAVVTFGGASTSMFIDSASAHAAPSASMTTGTTYHVWYHYKASTKIDIAFSTTTTRPTSGSNYAEATVGVDTPDVHQFIIAAQNRATGLICIVDNITVTVGGYYQP